MIHLLVLVAAISAPPDISRLPAKYVGISEYAIAREVVLDGKRFIVNPSPVNPAPDPEPKPSPDVCPNCGNKGYTLTPGDGMRVECNHPDCPVRQDEPEAYDCPFCKGSGYFTRNGKKYHCLNKQCPIFQDSGLVLLEVRDKNWYYVYRNNIRYRRLRPKGYERVTGKWVGKDLFQVCRGNSCQRFVIKGDMYDLRLHPEQYPEKRTR